MDGVNIVMEAEVVPKEFVLVRVGAVLDETSDLMNVDQLSVQHCRVPLALSRAPAEVLCPVQDRAQIEALSTSSRRVIEPPGLSLTSLQPAQGHRRLLGLGVLPA